MADVDGDGRTSSQGAVGFTDVHNGVVGEGRDHILRCTGPGTKRSIVIVVGKRVGGRSGSLKDAQLGVDGTAAGGDRVAGPGQYRDPEVLSGRIGTHGSEVSTALIRQYFPKKEGASGTRGTGLRRGGTLAKNCIGPSCHREKATKNYDAKPL